MKKIIFAMICVLGLFGTLKAQEVVSIDGTVGGFTSTTSEYTPIHNNYEYAITQFYYTAEEIDKASGTIESIAFKTCNDQGQDNSGNDKYPYTRSIDIYMLNTDEYNYGVGGRMTKVVSEEDLVFSGTVEFTVDSWIKIDLASGFEYTGNNLFVCINDYTGTYISNGGTTFESFECRYDTDEGLAYRALYKRSSSDKFDPTTSMQATQYKQIPNIQLTFAAGAEEYLEPAVPANLKAEAVNESKIKLSWDMAENAQSYNIYSGENLVANVNETSYFVKNLKLGEYCYTVTSVNGSKESAATEPACVNLVAEEIVSLQIGEERVQTGVGDPVSSETIPFGFSMGQASVYSWVEIPYSASLFEKAINIDRLAFDYHSGNQAVLDEIRIYLAEKTKVNATEWTAEEDLTLVYSDTDILVGEDKWETFEFDKPFEYKAENDLVVVIATAKSGDNIWMNRSSWYFDKVDNNTLYRMGEESSFAQYPTEVGIQHYARPIVKISWLAEDDINEGEEEDVLISYNFEDFADGDKLAENASKHWDTWSGKTGSDEDATIVEADGNKYVRFVSGNDQILKLGGYASGCYEISFDIYVPEGKSGYYNILHDFNNGDAVWSLQQYIHLTDDGSTECVPAEGHGTTHAGGTAVADMPFVYDEWMNIRYVIDIDNDLAECYYSVLVPGEGETKTFEWKWSSNSFGDETVPNRKLDAMNFYPPLNTSEFYLDNFKLVKISGESVVEVSFDTEKLQANAAVNDNASVKFTVENTGTTITDYMVWIDYGVSESTSVPFFINYDENIGENTILKGLNVEIPEIVEVGAMFPASSYSSSAAGTKITHMSYPFAETSEGSGYGIVEGSDVVFRIYGQGFNGQPGDILAEKVLPYNEINAGTFSIVKLDEPVILSGFNVWATVSFMHEAQSEEAPQFPIAFDGKESNLPPYSDLIRFGNEGPFTMAHEAFQQSYGSIHIRMTCSGEPVIGGWAELDKADGYLAVGETETISVDLNTFGLEAEKTYDAKIVFTLSNAEETFELPLSLQVQGDNVEEILSNTYNIYPNPTANTVTVEGDNINYIAIYNSVGQLVEVVKTQDNIVDMSAYENGIYFFNIVDNNNNNSIQRVVVAK